MEVPWVAAMRSKLWKTHRVSDAVNRNTHKILLKLWNKIYAYLLGIFQAS